MRGENKVSVFACGNGDSILIEAHGRTVLTDVHYRTDQAEDRENDRVPDFAPEIRAACPDNHLHVDVVTHLDKDHVGGWCDLFHCGPPEIHIPWPKTGEPKIIVDEIWCSPYAVNPNYVTDQAKPLYDEIRRRYALRETPPGQKDGNRLVIMDTSTHSTGVVVTGLEWRLLAPNKAEWNIPRAAANEPQPSSNSSSLVIQWTVTVGTGKNLIFLGGDSTVEVMERIEREVWDKDPDYVAWHILVALHHCSRHSIGRVTNGGCQDEEFEESKAALRALGEQRGDGYVVSSSKRIIRGAQTPPSFHAKNRYLNILAGKGQVTDAVRSRFLCTGGDTEYDKPDHVVFYLTPMGPTRPQKRKAPATITGIGTSSAGRGGGYG